LVQYTFGTSTLAGNFGKKKNFPLVENLITGADGPEWFIEYGNSNAPVIPNLDVMFKSDDVGFYGGQLYEIEHTNYIGIPEDGLDAPSGPVVLSVESKTKQHKQQDKLRCIIRTRDEFKRTWLPSDFSYPKSFLRGFPEIINIRWEKVKNPDLGKELVSMEERSILATYKFGVLYSKDDQSENDLFAVTEDQTSVDYKEFLEFLGDKILLEGWTGFRGGLDVKTNTTGTHSIYTKLHSYEIMFHVATLLPSQEADLQRVERKRHIGNDVVAIIFHEGKKPFNVTLITSQFIRVLVIVQKVKDETKKTKYCLVVANRGVSEHMPVLPDPPVFEADSNFHTFFLTKCVNAERTALRAEDIRLKMARTNGQLLNHLVTSYNPRDVKKKK